MIQIYTKGGHGKMVFVVSLLLGCSRDVAVGIENLPEDSQFSLQMMGLSSTLTDNVWSFEEVSSGEYEIQLYYGNHQCMLTSPKVEVPNGFGTFFHQSDWNCPGSIGYETILVSREDGSQFHMGKSEVTVGLWHQLMGEEGDDLCGVTCPKSGVSWITALKFANQMSMLEGLQQCYSNDENKQPIWNENCNGWRLPTDAEWDLAASNGKTKYSGSDDLSQVGWFRENSEMTRHPVCELKSNEFGFCDMTGNVWEWCWDANQVNTDNRRVRGGGYSSRDEIALLSNKIEFPRGHGADHIGFRLVRER